MSLLLGVRGADRKKNGQSFPENITQQPGLYYNNDPSFWANSPFQPLWRELPLANEIPSSSTAAHLSLPTSAAFKFSTGMTEEKYWQDNIRSNTVRGEGLNTSKPEQHWYIPSTVQPNGKATNTYRSSDPPISPFNFGCPTQSTLLSNSSVSPFAFSAKDSYGSVENEKSASDDRLKRADMEPSSVHKNEKSWKLGTSEAGAKPHLHVSSRNSFAKQQRFVSEAQTQASENDGLRYHGGNKSAHSDTTDSNQNFIEKKKPEVFVFGASGSGGSSFKSSSSQQKLFQSSFTRSRASKFKRHSNSPKGKGLAPIGDSGVRQSTPTFSREASPESITGRDSVTESVQLDEAECSDAGLWQQGDVSETAEFEEGTISRAESLQEENFGARSRNGGPQEDLLHRDREESVPQSLPFRQGYTCPESKAQENATSWQALSARIGSWWPFQSKNEADSSLEADGFSETLKENKFTAQLGETLNEPNEHFEQQKSGDLNPSATHVMPSECHLHSLPDGSVNEERSKLKISGNVSSKEPIQSPAFGSKQSNFNIGGKDSRHLFVFGAALQQADSGGENFIGRSATTAATLNVSKNEKLQGSGGLTEGFRTSMASDLGSTSAALPLGTKAGSAAHKGRSSINNESSFSPVFSTSTPITGGTSNSGFPRGVNLSTFTEVEKEGPTGEFSGHPSCSESSDSEDSSSRAEPWQTSDRPLSPDHCFKFQGNVKDDTPPLAMGKSKARTTARVRRYAGVINRPRRTVKSTSLKNIPTPMEISPSINDVDMNSGVATLEQPCFEFSATNSMDSGKFGKQLSDLQHRTEPTSVSSNFNVDNDEGISPFVAGNQDFEGSNDWNEHTIFSSKRSGKWKRRGSDEGHSSPSYQKSQGLPGFDEKGKNVAVGDSTSDQDASKYEPIFTFGAVSSHTSSASMHRRSVLTSPMEKRTEADENPTFDRSAFVPDILFSLDQERQPHVRPGSMFSFPSVSTEKDPPSEVSGTPPSTQSNTFLRNSEDFAAVNADAVHHFSERLVGSTKTVKSAAAEQECETWRLRGNKAYANGDFPKAEEYYSRGARSVSPSETSQSCIRASMLCYSNRAATRMAVGRMREALADCKRAMVVDPGFLRVRIRAASCHLALGESNAAADMFKECLKYAKENTKSDPKILVEAMEGLKKSQQLDEYSDRAGELLQKQTLMDSTSALRLLNEALSISPFSEPLHELKGQALLSLRRYDECLQFCEQTLLVAERNHGSTVHEKQQDSYLKEPCQGSQNTHLKLWRWRLSAKALHNLGKLEESLELLVKHEEALSSCSVNKGTDRESRLLLISNIRDQLRYKVAGNEAFQLGKHTEAVENYTAALACNVDSRPFNSVCFCNRAAAWQALGHIADAIADCSRAIALDPVYPKALSRRATLHEMIRDYGQACNDLRRLIALLEEQNLETNKEAMSNVTLQDLRQAKERLEKEEEEIKKDHPIDHYLVLGVDFSCSANEIKKAYRKAALKHHPDKAGQFLVRTETGEDGGLWSEVGDEVRRDAERLFKLIGEAYAILSDATKRLRYDMEEENRKLRGKDGNNQVPSSSTEGYRSQYEKNNRRQQRDRWESWPGFAPQHHRWQSGPDAAQPDTYGRKTTYSGDPAKTGKTTWNTDFFWDKI